MENTAQGNRWGTANAGIAACLLTYGYKLCAEQPFIRLQNPDHSTDPKRSQLTFWFDPIHPQNATELEAKDEPQAWEVRWRHWKEFRDAHPTHPWVSMRSALNAREWLFGGAGNHKPETLPAGVNPFETRDFNLAACLIALRFHLYDHGRGTFIFREEAKQRAALYEKAQGAHAIVWMRRAIEMLDALHARVKQPDNVPVLPFKHGNRIALIPADCPERVRRPLILLLHAA